MTKYAAIYRPKVNTRGGEYHVYFGTVTLTEFADKEAMETHIRTCAKEADSYEYIRYETLTVNVKVEIE